jgi:hypothetical protein
MTGLEKRWYWDRRNDKAYYPVQTGDDTISFVTVWHAEEVKNARECDVLTPIEETDFTDPERPLGLKESFRLPENPMNEGDD